MDTATSRQLDVESFPKELYDPNSWQYKAEGNANVVLAFVGSVDEFQSTILRLKKSAPSAKIETRQPSSKSDSARFDASYIRDIITPLLGREYIYDSILLPVAPDFLHSISRSILPLRPTKFLNKDIDTHQPYAVLIPDHTKFVSLKSLDPNAQTLSVEIKPKWGFLPTSSYISASTSIKYKRCRYCMHQYWKLDQDKMAVKLNAPLAEHPAVKCSKYCPLDLYSLEERRMKQALQDLIDIPANNFKLFLDGVEIDIKRKNWHTALIDFFDLNKENPEQSYITVRDSLITLLTHTLKNEPLLPRLKHHQKSLDEFDIEGVHHLLESLPTETNITSREPTLEEWEITVKQYLKRMNEIPLVTVDSRNPVTDHDFIRQRVYEFLLSATIKDCSIMIAFRTSKSPNINNNEGQVDFDADAYSKKPSIFQERTESIAVPLPLGDNQYNTQHFNYKIAVVDLDPKATAKLQYYYDRDAQIVKNFMKYLDQEKLSEKQCIE